MSDYHSMRCMLAECVQEAVKLALIDSTWPEGRTESWTDEERQSFREDIHNLPSEALAGMDPGALSQNVACRLLGYGGWFVGGKYGGNATGREIFEATFQRPDQDTMAELAFDLGLKPSELVEPNLEMTFSEPEEEESKD